MKNICNHFSVNKLKILNILINSAHRWNTRASTALCFLGKKGLPEKLAALLKGACGYASTHQPEKAGLPPPPGCYLPDS
ncbi:hypothetical protein [Enterobacter sp. Colony194]|uniref:hypothetical protein n=1 Tax=Enterobacter sp. Colony194 TaxID=2866201 RepID=UPI001C6A636B|nr:hypothetical protein [Enterobacter sp. Colony194]